MFLAFALLLASSVASSHAFSGTFLDGKYTLTWDASGAFSMSGTTTGYVGFGFGSEMVGSDAVCGWVANGASTVKYFYLGGTRASLVTEKTGMSLYNTSGVEASGTTTIQFIIPLASTVVSGGPQDIIVAMGDCDDVCDHDSNMAKATIDFTTGEFTETREAIPQSIHAALMSIAYGLGFPSGAVIARYFPRAGGPLWFNMHRGIQMGSLLLALIAFAIIVAKTAKDGGDHFTETHQILGLVVTILVFLQPFNAAARPPPGPTVKRRVWFWAHRLQALCIQAIGLAAIVTGFQTGNDDGVVSESQEGAGIGIVFAVFGVICVVAVVLEFIKTKAAGAAKYNAPSGGATPGKEMTNLGQGQGFSLPPGSNQQV